ncbi:hypothetical protein F2Q70_00037223 [Brassica cretica]|uniref:Aspartic peptidase DDI1-type domain-containing protein n=1 Tax=Brassica cretica TaxID=69181 RepID=A0A8S9K1R5_BRACR|nr:hypothetical protein F2Q70_00037223 [Brassica cretica]
MDGFTKRVLRIPIEKPFDEAYFTHRLWMFFRETKVTEEDIRRMFHQVREKMKHRITLTKKSDPGKFVIPCVVKGVEFPHSMCDTGASVSILPRIMADQLCLSIEPSTESFTFVDLSEKRSGVIIRDLEVQIGNALVPVDFHFLDIELNWNSSLLLGRSFLATVGAVCDMNKNNLCLTLIDPNIHYDPIRPKRKVINSVDYGKELGFIGACHCGAEYESEYETEYSESVDTPPFPSIDSNESTVTDDRNNTSLDVVQPVDHFASPNHCYQHFAFQPPSKRGHDDYSIGSWVDSGIHESFAVDTDERLETHKFTNTFPTSDPDGNARAMGGKILQVSREDIADILQVANGPKNLFSQQRGTPDIIQTDPNNHVGVATREINPDLSRQPKEQASIDGTTETSIDRVTPTSIDIDNSTSINRRYECGNRAFDMYGARKFTWEQRDEYGVYRDECGHARCVAGEMIPVTKGNIRKLLERASLFEESHICLQEHATSFTLTTLAPELYTKDEIDEMVFGICGAQEKLGDELKSLVEDTHQPLDRGYNELFRCMAQMRTEIESLHQQLEKEATTSTSIDATPATSIDVSLPITQIPAEPQCSTQHMNEWEVSYIDTRIKDVYCPLNNNVDWLSTKFELLQQDLDTIRKKDQQPATSIDMCTFTLLDAKVSAMNERLRTYEDMHDRFISPVMIDLNRLTSQLLHAQKDIENTTNQSFLQAKSASIDRLRGPWIDGKKPVELLLYTAAEVDKITSKIYTALDTMEERLDKRCDDIYFPFDNKITQHQISASIDRTLAKSIDRTLAKSIDGNSPRSTNEHIIASIDAESTPVGEQLIHKTVESMQKELTDLSAYAYDNIGWHQVSIDNVQERLQNISNCRIGYSESIDTPTFPSIDSNESTVTDDRNNMSLDVMHPVDHFAPPNHCYQHFAFQPPSKRGHDDYSIGSWADSGFHESFAVDTVITSPNEEHTKEYDEDYWKERVIEMSLQDERLETHKFTNTFPTSFDAVHSASVDTHPRPAKQPLTSIDTHTGKSIDIRAAAKIQEQENIPSPTRDPDGNARAIDGRILQVSREEIADILQVANGPDNLFSQQRGTPDVIQTDLNNHVGVTTTEINPDLSHQPKGQESIDGTTETSINRVTSTSIDRDDPTSIDRQYEFGNRAFDIYEARKFT